MHKTVHDFNQAAAWLLSTLLFISTVPFGAVEAWATGVLEVLLFALLIAALSHGRWSGRTLCLPHLVAAALFISLHLIQIVPLPGRVLERISPLSHYIFQALRPEDARHLYETISISPDVTLSCLIWFSGCLAAYILIGLACRQGNGSGRDKPNGGERPVFFFGIPARNRTEKAALTLALTLAAGGTFQAAYGLAEHLMGWNRIFFYVRRYPMEGVAGTFINTNSCAAFLALCLPLTLSLILYLSHFKGRNPGNPDPGGGTTVLGSARCRILILLLSAAATLMALALLFTRSGGGIISSSVGLTLFFLYSLFRRSPEKPLLPYLTIVAVAIMGLAVIGLFATPDFTMTTLVTETTGDASGRFIVWIESMTICRDFPLFGSGAGTYQQMMLHYFNRMTVHAHNEYVELLCDLGPLGLLLVLFLLLSFGRLVRTLLFHESRNRSRPRSARFPSTSILPLGYAVSLLGLMVHCLVDFPLRIPAIALAGSCLFGVLTAMSADRRGHRATGGPAVRGLLLLFFALLLCVSSVRLFEAAARKGGGYEGCYQTAREGIDMLSRADSATTPPGPFSPTVEAVESCILARPLDVRGHHLAFELARLEGSRTRMERALVHGTLARPAQSQLSFALGQFLLEQGRFREGMAWFHRSLELNDHHLDAIYNFCMQIFSRRFDYFEFIFPKEPALRERLGELLQSSGLVDQSLEQYQWCLTQRPDRAKLHARIARIHREKREYAEALAAIGEAHRLDPAGREAYSFLRATVLLQMGDVSEATEVCRALLSANPAFEAGYELLAMCHLEQGEVWRAIGVYRTALWRTREKSRIHRLLGDQYSGLGEQRLALEQYEASCREASTDHQRKYALYRMGTCYERMKKPDEALDALTRAKAITSEGKPDLDPLIADALARISAPSTADS